MMSKQEETRAAELLEAQRKAEQLFNEIEARGLVRPGITESALNDDTYALAKEMYGITIYWHKRIVRAGRNTLLPYAGNPPSSGHRQRRHSLFLDLGPVFEQWEADFGRTFVLGSDPRKHKLQQDVGHTLKGQAAYFHEAHPKITSSELYRYAPVSLAGQ